MTRIDALREVGRFVRQYESVFSGLPKDGEGKPDNLEIRRRLAADPEIAIALAAMLATVYFSIECEAGILAGKNLEGKGQ